MNYPSRYCRVEGRLIYLTITRPDLCYAVHIFSQFMQVPREEHMNAACVLRHIKGTPGCGILLHASKTLHLSAYCDSDWGAENQEASYCTRSSAEVEYRSMVAVTSELVWLKSLLASL